MTSAHRWPIALIAVLACFAAVTWLLIGMQPVKDGTVNWLTPLFAGGWTTWTLAITLVLLIIALMLASPATRAADSVIMLIVVLSCFAIATGTLVRMLPVKDAARDWFAPLVKGGWMAWTLPTALFFLTIALLLACMAIWEFASPGGNPRVGLLRFETTRGDRLFISLLGSAFIHLAWLGLIGSNLWWALALSVVYAVGVFKTV